MPGLIVWRSWFEGDFYTAAVAPDGRWLASGASDGPLWIWGIRRWQNPDPHARR